tara:strand:- start:765 stop:1241 length:477 start_codon:yes stop_codon:yes gene_type:complete
MSEWDGVFTALSPVELEKLAVLRVLECTNGVCQHRFRENHPEALSIEDTRIAMGFSMSSIKRMKIELSNQTIDFDADTKAIMAEVRKLYIDGFKNSDKNSQDRFYEASLACLNACGIDRLKKAHDLLIKECNQLPSYTYNWGIDYISRFMNNEDSAET